MLELLGLIWRLLKTLFSTPPDNAIAARPDSADNAEAVKEVEVAQPPGLTPEEHKRLEDLEAYFQEQINNGN